MVDDELGPDEASSADTAALAIAARHALHDEELVAALATDSLEDAREIERTRSLLERCTACRSLHDEVAAIGTALRSDARGSLVAPRDFRLTVQDAQRLGGPVLAGPVPVGPVPVGGFFQAFRLAFGKFAGPVGASMAAMGIVGLLVGSVALGGGGAASAPTGENAMPAAASAAPADLTTGLQGGGGRPRASDRVGAFQPGASAAAESTETDTSHDAAALNPDPFVLLLAGSVALLVGGVVLLLVAFRRGGGSGSTTRDP